MPPPWTVPRFMVACSRIKLSSPSSVEPPTTTCDISLLSGPIRARAPITQNGPTETPSASSAPLATMAVGWISTLTGSGLHDHGGELALGGDRLADHRPALELEDIAARAQHLDV